MSDLKKGRGHIWCKYGRPSGGFGKSKTFGLFSKLFPFRYNQGATFKEEPLEFDFAK
jgi:hypothetical protein